MDKYRLPNQPDWDFQAIENIDREIARVAKNFQLDTYPNQLEIITSEHMMDAYSSVGLPTYYNHWSFGKSFIETEHDYKKGQSGLAYEIVINSNPCIAYLMEENSLMMQALVIAHASYGHNSFFKGNYLFRTWTDAEGIVDYMLFAKRYLTECESKYGVDKVEKLLDSCHALQNFGVDRYKRPVKDSLAVEKAKQKEREEYAQSQVNDLWRTLPRKKGTLHASKSEKFPSEPQENILYFIEKNAPLLAPWEREVIRIVRKVAQYFYPQRQTQVMNEGWATFWHYTILNQLYEEDIVGDGFMMEFLQSHTSVTYQHPRGRINPYALGFAMMVDIRRMCENPTDEDRKWFPDIVDTDWLETLDFAMRNFKDESFIQQYLSPKVMRDFHMYSVLDDHKNNFLKISSIHDDSGYRHIRDALSSQYRLSDNEPDIQIVSVDIKGDRSMKLQYLKQQERPLNDHSYAVMRHIERLWGFDAHLNIVSGV